MGRRQWASRKVVIVGAGAVGSTFAYALAQSGIANEIAIIDQNDQLAQGQVWDLAHGLAFFPQLSIHVGTLADYQDATVIVITAGAKQQPGETRLMLLNRNATMMQKIAKEIGDQDSPAIIIVTSNPVDVLTQVVLNELNWPSGRVIGSGTVLDSARFRYLLSQYWQIDVHNIHGYILGEHGDSEFAAWSMTHVAGKPAEHFCPICKSGDDWTTIRKTSEDEVKKSAYHIIDYKGATNYAIGLALVRIVTSILRNQRSVLSVSTLLKGEYGLENVCLSLPCILSQDGVERVIAGDLTEEEQHKLCQSATILKQGLGQLSQTPQGVIQPASQ